MSQVAGSIAAASPQKGGAFSQAAGAATKAVPESGPPSPESLKGSEADLASIMARLAHLEECNLLGNAALEKEKMDNARLERSLRESIAKNRQQEREWQVRNEEEEWQDDAPEANETSAEGPNFAPTMPTSYVMTPQKPPGNLEDHSWQDEWVPAAAVRGAVADENRWWLNDGERKDPGDQQWCQPAWGTTWQMPQQCDPWAAYSRSQPLSRDHQNWSSSTDGNWHGQWNGGWGSQWV